MHGFQQVGSIIGSPEIVLGCLLALAGLFGWAGIGKILHPYHAAVAAVNLRVASRPSKRVGRALGTAELAVALSLLAFPDARAAGAAAAFMSAGFFAVVALALARGERFACGCLGSEEQIGGLTLWRSGLMFAAAIIVATMTSSRPAQGVTWAEGVTIACLALGVPLALLVWRRGRVAARELEESLDWYWISQRGRQQGQVVAGGEGAAVP